MKSNSKMMGSSNINVTAKNMKSYSMPGAKLESFLDVLLKDPEVIDEQKLLSFEELASIMEGIPMVLGYPVENRSGAYKWSEFASDYMEMYRQVKPDDFKKLDPYFVQLVAPDPVALQNALGSFPGPVSPMPQPAVVEDAAPLVLFSFDANATGRRDAHHLIGFLQAHMPNLRVMTFTTAGVSYF
jgi:hypothetical protein